MVGPYPLQQLSNLRPDIHEAMEEFDLFLNQNRMIALKVFPVVETMMAAGSYPRVKIEALLRAVDTSRASGGAYNFTEFDFEDDTFATKENGIVVPTDNRNMAIYNQFGLELLASKIARHQVYMNQEIRVANLMLAQTTNALVAGNGSGGAGTPTPWSNSASATPINDVEQQVQLLYNNGIQANCLIVSLLTFRNLRNCAQIIDRISAHGAGNPAKPTDVTVQMLAACFDLDHILVAGAQTNTANEAQTPALSPIWPKANSFVCRIAEGPDDSFVTPSVGRTFHWGGDGSSIDGTYETWYDEEIRGTKVRMRMETQEKVVYPNAVAQITGC